jgi:hypothetical protein
VLVAGLVAATVSGAPSTVHALLTGGDPLVALAAAGTLIPGRRDRPGIVAGMIAHVVVSAGWVAVLAEIDRRRPLGVAGGAAAGLAIAALDLHIADRAFPAVRALPQLPQWLDHAAFGALLGGLLARRRSCGDRA